jgi:hypothetical protein
MLLWLTVLEAAAATTAASATTAPAWLSVGPNLIVGLGLTVRRAIGGIVAVIGIAGLYRLRLKLRAWFLAELDHRLGPKPRRSSCCRWLRLTLVAKAIAPSAPAAAASTTWIVLTLLLCCWSICFTDLFDVWFDA